MIVTTPLETLLKFNQLGLIPGPDENEEQFLQRAQYCLKLKEQLVPRLKENLPMMQADFDSSCLFLKEAYPKTKKLFDIVPDWIPVFFSNYRLAPWHGGCAWIFQSTEDSPTGAFFQLRNAFRTQERYLHLYDRKDLIAHELAHVGRMTFQEPVFEEMLAYQTSSSGFQRLFGPIVQSSRESSFFVLVLIFVFLIDFFLVVNGQEQMYSSVMWLKIIPLGLIAYALQRLFWKHRQLKRCLNQLQMAIQDKDKSSAMIYRLQDHEIKSFALMTPKEIFEYAKQNSQLSLRWHISFAAYFRNNS